MSRNTKYDIFISFRRDGAAEAARLISERLTKAGYRVFFYDNEFVPSDEFNEQVYSAIECCSDFLVVLPKNGLDECVSDPENDWLTKEVTYAYSSFARRVPEHSPSEFIIPILLRGFEFPTELPENMAFLNKCNGVTVSNDYFEAVIDKLISNLHSQGNITRTSVIRLVNSAPSSSGNELEPDTEPTNVIDIRKYPAMVFSIFLCETWGSSENCECDWAVTDFEQHCLFTQHSSVAFQPNYSVLRLGLNLKTENEVYNPGEYTAVFRIHGEKYSYKFYIIDGEPPKANQIQNKRARRNRPVFSIISFVMSIFAVAGCTLNNIVPLLLLFAAPALATVSLIKKEPLKGLAISALAITLVIILFASFGSIFYQLYH